MSCSDSKQVDTAMFGIAHSAGAVGTIGTLPAARSDTHGTPSRCTVRGTVLCRAVGFVLASQRRMRTADFKLILYVKITSCAAWRQVSDNF